MQCLAFSLWWLLLFPTAQTLGDAGLELVAPGLSCLSVCGIFPDQDRTHVPCIDRRILIHCATWEVLVSYQMQLTSFFYNYCVSCNIFVFIFDSCMLQITIKK